MTLAQSSAERGRSIFPVVSVLVLFDSCAQCRHIVERGPIPAIHGVVRWRLIDLMQWVWEE
jgi:hypothetical protein